MQGSLCLVRKRGERVVLEHQGTQILVEVGSIRGDRVQLQFVAPPEVTINREEVWYRIEEERKTP